jgi:hypothetical protein
MTTRADLPGESIKLVTAELAGDAAAVVEVPLAIPTSEGGSCPRAGNDATAWVTSNGDLMLFRGFPVDASCSPTDSDATDLYAVILNPMTGQPPAGRVAVAMTDVNRSTGNSTETDPSLSNDLCFLYFASDSGTGVFEFDVFRAARN